MCNAKALGTVALVAIGVATGGFGFAAAGAAGAAGAGAAAAGAAGAGAAAAGAAGAATAATAASTGLTALQTASLLSTAAGTAVSAYGQYQQGKAQQQAARYNAQVADLNRQDALDRGDQEQQMVGRRAAQLRARQRVGMAANGLDLSSGTPEALLDQTDYYGLEDQRTVAENARREAAGYGQRSMLYGRQADSIDPMGSAAGSLLANAGAVSDRWYRYRRG